MASENRAMMVCSGLAAALALACSGTPPPDPPPEAPPVTAPAPDTPAAPAVQPPAAEAPAVQPPAAAPPTAAAPPKTKPTPDPKMSPADRAAYHAALKAGRTAHRAGDYPAAIAAFDRALVLFADDPRALNERGWARYKGGDLPGAEADTRQALARTVDARLIGASHYNLGRIFEDRGQPELAIQAWRQSLLARPNATVRARLARLDPAAASALRATPLAGPFADEAALCAHLKAAGAVDNAACAPLDPPVAGAPFGARLARTYESLFEDSPAGPDGTGSETWHLVLDVPAGRFVLPGLASAYNPGAFGIFEEVTVEPPAPRALADGRTVLWVAATHDRRDSDMGLNEVELSSERTIYACGVGPSGVPSCVGPLLARLSASREIQFEDEDEPGMQHDLWQRSAEFTVELLDSGAVQVKAVGTPSKGIDQGHVGTHRLEFP